MPLVSTELKASLIQAGQQSESQLAAKLFAEGYCKYLTKGQATTAPAPLPVAPTVLQLASTLGPILLPAFVSPSLPPVSAAAMELGLIGWWSSNFAAIIPGATLAVATPTLSPLLIAASAIPTTNDDLAKQKIAQALDTWTRTILITGVPPPVGTPGPIV